jgi:hypothetical protein
MDQRVPLVLNPAIGRVLAFAALGDSRLVTTFTPVRHGRGGRRRHLAELHREAVQPSDERTAGIVSRRWG